MNIERITPEYRQQVNDFITAHWGSTDMVIRGLIVDIKKTEGFLLFDYVSIIGLITYIFDGEECEITSLDSLRENCGIGTALIEKVKVAALQNCCTKLRLITTNDNTKALRFYQKRGFDLVRLYHNSLNTSRKLKPQSRCLERTEFPLDTSLNWKFPYKI